MTLRFKVASGESGIFLYRRYTDVPLTQRFREATGGLDVRARSLYDVAADHALAASSPPARCSRWYPS